MSITQITRLIEKVPEAATFQHIEVDKSVIDFAAEIAVDNANSAISDGRIPQAPPGLRLPAPRITITYEDVTFIAIELPEGGFELYEEYFIVGSSG